MPLYLSDLTADPPLVLTGPFLKASLAHFLASARILALFLCDLAFGPAPHHATVGALFAKAHYAAAVKLQLCGSTFPVVDNWLTFLPAATACVDVPWFFTLLAALAGLVGTTWLVAAVVGFLWWVLRGVARVVPFLLEGLGEFAYWAVGVLGGWLGMREGEGEKGVPVVVVVDTEMKGRRRGRRMG